MSRPFNSSQQLKDYLGILYVSAAQYDNPSSNPVKSVCDAIDGAPKGSDVLDKIASASNANIVLPCHIALGYLYNQRYNGWFWQVILVNGDVSNLFISCFNINHIFLNLPLEKYPLSI